MATLSGRIRIYVRPFWPVLLLAFSACTLIQAKPANPSPFLEKAADLKDSPKGVPFQRVWFSNPQGLRDIKRTYKRVYFSPVDTSALGAQKGGAVADAISLGASPDDIKDISRLLHDEFASAMKERAGPDLGVADRADESTLIVETALVELKPTNTVLKAGHVAAGFFIPGSQLVSSAISAGTAAAASPLSTGSIAIEIKFRNGSDGKLLGEVSDRQADPMTVLVNARDFTKFGHARSTVRRWARASAEFLTTPPSHPVAKPLPLTFALW